jgi:hypothetical protein
VDNQHVKVRTPCDRCDGQGRVPGYSGVTGGYEIGEDAGTELCPDCGGHQYTTTDWMTMEEFRRRYPADSAR